MCGIVGILGREEAAPRLMRALKRLEYRGYDSAGIAVLTATGMDRRRAEGKLQNLEALLEEEPIGGTSGIGHTRWATHGAPTLKNAHPHTGEGVAIVHNGIIENYLELRHELEAGGHIFETDTDTETVAHLIAMNLKAGATPRQAVHSSLGRIKGAFALAIIIDGHEDLMFGARLGSPLVIGFGNGETYLGSDAIALAGMSNRLTYLEEGDWVELSHAGATIFDVHGIEVERPQASVAESDKQIEKGNYHHFMQKEIFEQPSVVGQTLGAYIDAAHGAVQLPELPFELEDIPRITLVACGTSLYAAMVAQYWIERLARVPVDVDIASEFRYRDAVLTPGGLSLFISQSGETADTLAAMRHCKAKGQHIAAIVNVEGSTMAREADVVLPTHAGPEIGVASTKSFTCQLSVLAAFALALGKAKGVIDPQEEAELCEALSHLPSRMVDVLYHDESLKALAQRIAKSSDVLYLGRGAHYPIALEGALKLKEISYIHAEGYAAGEMKHGPIALVDEGVPIIVIAPSDRLFEKTASNMQEVIARGGRVVMISDKAGLEAHGKGAMATIEMPVVDELVAPILYALPVQILAYHAAVAKGTDVDQPRNLAKSVTVE
jgi:glucosamine--fructose-6-phosphate aminotransferase (isomerizing)